MSTADTTTTDNRFNAADLLTQAMIQEIAVSPDGESVVYSRRVVENGNYRKRLWRVPYAGGVAEPLTTADASDGGPAFSPDGRSLLFISNRNEKSQVWVLSVAGGEPRKVVEFPHGISAAAWSPDGSRILVIAPSGIDRFIVGDQKDPTARRITEFTWRMDGVGILDQHQSIYVVPSTGGEAVRLTDPSMAVRSAVWSPNGTRIGFVADLDPDSGLRVFEGLSKFWAISADDPGSIPELLAELTGSVANAIWSQTGIAIVGSNHLHTPNWANPNLYLVESGKPRQLAPELDRPIQNTTFGDLIDPSSGVSFEWLDAKSLVAVVNDEGSSHPYRFGTDGSVERLAVGEITASAIASGGGNIVVVASDRGKPGEVYAVEGGGLRQLTTNGSDWLEPYRKDPLRIRVPHPDGHTVDAFLIEGRNAPKPGPMAIQIHGGPHGSHGPTPWLEMLALSDAGIHVIYPNPRGSTGYGEEFARAIHGDWGGPDASDHLCVIDWAIAEGITDPARVGVFGLSGGGYMTTWLLGHHPGRFAAGVAENPVTDLVSMFAGSDLSMYYDERFVGVGKLPENIDAFLRHSPFMYLHRNEAPLLLLHCDGDLRCPPMQSEMAFAILKSRGCTVEMVRYPEESHFLAGFGRPDRRVDRIERIVGWLEKYLL